MEVLTHISAAKTCFEPFTSHPISKPEIPEAHESRGLYLSFWVSDVRRAQCWPTVFTKPQGPNKSVTLKSCYNDKTWQNIIQKPVYKGRLVNAKWGTDCDDLNVRGSLSPLHHFAMHTMTYKNKLFTTSWSISNCTKQDWILVLSYFSWRHLKPPALKANDAGMQRI